MIIISCVVYNTYIEDTLLFKYYNKLSNNFRVIFLDNSNDEDIIKHNKSVALENDTIKYHSLGDNVGLPKAYNYVIKNEIFDAILILDQDTEIEFDFFDFISNINLDEEIVAYPKMYCNSNLVSPRKLKSNVFFNNKKGVDMPINSCSLISRKVFDKVGLFNEEMFLDMVDYEFFRRCHDNEVKFQLIDFTIEQHLSGFEETNKEKALKRFKNYLCDFKVFSNYTFKTRIWYYIFSFYLRCKNTIRYRYIKFLFCKKESIKK